MNESDNHTHMGDPVVTHAPLMHKMPAEKDPGHGQGDADVVLLRDLRRSIVAARLKKALGKAGARDRVAVDKRLVQAAIDVIEGKDEG